MNKKLATSAAVSDFTGERADPEASPAETMQEHAARYVFAGEFCHDKDVLDVASGQGYGTEHLRRQGARVTGLEIDASTVQKAQLRYPFSRFMQGEAESMPEQWSQAFDVVVSFETIEHLHRPEAFVQEVYRCLRPGGVFVCSTPNKSLTLFQEGNRFHIKEFSQREFMHLLGSQFSVCEVYGQTFHSHWYVPWAAFRAVARKILRALRIPPLGVSTALSKSDHLTPFDGDAIANVQPRFMPALVRRHGVPTFLVVVASKRNP